MKHALAALALAVLGLTGGVAEGQSRAERNEVLFGQLAAQRGVSGSAVERIRAIFQRSSVLGQGNPAITRHALTAEECRARGPAGGYANAAFERICGAKFMAPLYDPRTQRPEQATSCIDQFEYPNIPCTYPVVWVKANEAAQICAAEGKRLCDAHEWEGACAGALEPPDYRFDLGSHGAMRAWHNAKYQKTAAWAYGPAFRRGVCAQNSFKSDTCPGGGYGKCGSNTYPTGSFPGCTSALQVYDIHGNAAEHMNLPLREDQMASRGSTKLGVTEMKGSWFIWDKINAHPDWCRWRAPYWHGTPVMSAASHENYHLGFRCCKSVK